MKKIIFTILGIILIYALTKTISFRSESKIQQIAIKQACQDISNTAIQIQAHINTYIDPTAHEMSNASFDLPLKYQPSSIINSLIIYKAPNSTQIAIFAPLNSEQLGKTYNSWRIVDQPYIKFIGTIENNQIIWQHQSNLANWYLPHECK